jgi:multimeric flavodoxin WrbA
VVGVAEGIRSHEPIVSIYVDIVNMMCYVASVNIGGGMEILVLDGNPDPAHRAWEEYLGAFAKALDRVGAGVRTCTLREMDIHYCTGCWSCWWKTPGLCTFKDDMTGVYPVMLASDLVVWASPLVLGNVSALTKKAQDRFIPLLHPYIELVNGESHHRRRYPKDIDMGLIIETADGDTREDAEIVRHMHERLALNGRGRLRFFATTARGAEEVANEAVGA